jgi:hypothetical protein
MTVGTITQLTCDPLPDIPVLNPIDIMPITLQSDRDCTDKLTALAADERARRDEARSRQARINARGRSEAMARMVEQTASKPAHLCTLDAIYLPECCAQWRRGYICANTGGACPWRKQAQESAR